MVLLLQLELGFGSSQSPFVMGRFGHRLMVTAKERPGNDVGVGDRVLPDQGPDQAQDFGHTERDQPELSPRRILNAFRLPGQDSSIWAFFSCSALAWPCINMAHSWATSESVTCRYHPVQFLTSY